jgi:transcriptional regulator with XRE-family HTH domain
MTKEADMPIGYSRRIVAEIEQADTEKVGVRLAMICLVKDVPVKYVAERLGVSRVTVYTWFRGKTNVPERLNAKVQKLINKLS